MISGGDFNTHLLPRVEGLTGEHVPQYRHKRIHRERMRLVLDFAARWNIQFTNTWRTERLGARRDAFTRIRHEEASQIDFILVTRGVEANTMMPDKPRSALHSDHLPLYSRIRLPQSWLVKQTARWMGP